MRALTTAGLAAAAAVLAGCGSDPDPRPTVPDLAPPSTSVSSAAPTTTTRPVTVTSTRPRPSTTKPTRRPTASPTRHVVRATPKPTPTPPPIKPAVAPCAVPSGVTAAQVVLVTSSGSSATVRACGRSGSQYLLEHGPYAGHVGRNGVSWSKVEGDLKTPAGVYPLRGGFGIQANPGLRTGSWFTVDRADVWVDDPKSALYNTHQRTPVAGRWTSAEALYVTPAYLYAQVIGYNESRVPGKGSGIFFHVDQGRGTAGCVSIGSANLLTVLRWERPGAVMSIS